MRSEEYVGRRRRRRRGVCVYRWVYGIRGRYSKPQGGHQDSWTLEIESVLDGTAGCSRHRLPDGSQTVFKA